MIIMLKLLLFVLAAFCFVHIYRDYLQLKGVKNWFTQVGHVWDAPQYEKHGMVVVALLGSLLLLLGASI
ncbi:MAG: hypothetical protein WD850_02750 [Candidatus Spechtbacterales bacterium]